MAHVYQHAVAKSLSPQKNMQSASSPQTTQPKCLCIGLTLANANISRRCSGETTLQVVRLLQLFVDVFTDVIPTSHIVAFPGFFIMLFMTFVVDLVGFLIAFLTILDPM